MCPKKANIFYPKVLVDVDLQCVSVCPPLKAYRLMRKHQHFLKANVAVASYAAWEANMAAD